MGNGGKRGLAAVGLVILLTILFCLSARAEEGSVWTEEGSVSGDLGSMISPRWRSGSEWRWTAGRSFLHGASGAFDERAAGGGGGTLGPDRRGEPDGWPGRPGPDFWARWWCWGCPGRCLPDLPGYFAPARSRRRDFFITYLLLCALLAAGFGEGVRLAGRPWGRCWSLCGR